MDGAGPQVGKTVSGKWAGPAREDCRLNPFQNARGSLWITLGKRPGQR